MSDSKYYVGLITTAILLTIGYAYGCYTTRKDVRQSAIANGVGHYVITDQTNKVVEFQWITNR